ncbi:glycosyltransferase [Mammaliicoccus sciuri]|uniref:Glycosyltransferase n=1 Tax=Mammaliicoccus sciuri TaxID=1296 RepID=A0AB37HN17_MAMSC|nr:glycosyltransferase [Mammaliicoccus sciuri]QRN90968.1 glycosyltransferase [Mammaliicoccus sciuri]
MTQLVPIAFVHNIKKENGGLHKAIYHRMNVLSKVYDRVIIYTYSFDKDFESLCQYHKNIGNIDRRVEIINLYNEEKDEIEYSPIKYKKNNKYFYFPVADNPYTFRVFDEKGEYKYYLKLREDGTPDIKDYFTTPWKRYMKEVFDNRGILRKRIYMNDDNKPSYTVTFNNNSQPIVSSVLDKNGAPKNYFCFAHEIEYDTELEMAMGKFKEFIKTIEMPVLFVDKREHVKYFDVLNEKNIKKIFILHNNHLDYPYINEDVISPSVNDLFTSIINENIDRLIVLTNEQKKDILTQFSIDKKIEVIPHYQPIINKEINEKQTKLIVTLARYHNAKNLKRAIEIIFKVKKVMPDIIYNIYGYGPQKDLLAQLIKDLDLEKNVFLKGHINDPHEKLKEAKLSLMTSNYEGFCLAISESLACSTPVVSWNTKYGPSEIIRNGMDGYIVEDENEASEKILKILNMDDNEFNEMQKNSLDVSNRFSEESNNKLWINLLNDLSYEYES